MKEYTPTEVDQRFKVLSQYKRRCIFRFLREADMDRITVTDVADHLQKHCQVTENRDKLEGTLHHHHIPKLASTSVVDYDTRSGTVRYHNDELIEALLDSNPETCRATTAPCR